MTKEVKKAPYKRADRSDQELDAVHHVLHEYAKLVSSGKMVLAGKHKGKNLKPPINTHFQHAFLLNCRKFTLP